MINTNSPRKVPVLRNINTILSILPVVVNAFVKPNGPDQKKWLFVEAAVGAVGLDEEQQEEVETGESR